MSLIAYIQYREGKRRRKVFTVCSVTCVILKFFLKEHSCFHAPSHLDNRSIKQKFKKMFRENKEVCDNRYASSETISTNLLGIAVGIAE